MPHPWEWLLEYCTFFPLKKQWGMGKFGENMDAFCVLLHPRAALDTDKNLKF
jgi:hypothetical protein